MVAITAMSLIACGDDDDETTTGARPPARRSPRRPIEPSAACPLRSRPRASRSQQLPKASLNGAEAGVEISGDRSGAARSFATETEAQEYADEVAKDGDKTVIVGTVVIQAPTQDDADFFADAYEGG